MAIPDLDSLMLATLKALSGGGEIHISEVRDFVANEFGITSEERQETSANGKTLIFANRVNWATVDLKGAGLLERPQGEVIAASRRTAKRCWPIRHPESTENSLKLFPFISNGKTSWLPRKKKKDEVRSKS